MPISRRQLLLGATAACAAAPSFASARTQSFGFPTPNIIAARDFGIRPDSKRDQTKSLQRAIDAAAERRIPLLLPPGRVLSRRLHLRSNLTIIGAPHASEIMLVGHGARLEGHNLKGLTLQAFGINGRAATPAGDRSALVALHGVSQLNIDGLSLTHAPASALYLESCQGHVIGSTITSIRDAAIFSNNARGLALARNTISNCANNAILAWRDRIGEDATLVTNNRISHVRAQAGGSGQNGNGVNVYRAGNVIVSANHISDCAYSAIRSNSGSNVQIIGNNCTRIGEVALYAEFAFQGAVIANNLIDRSATGISVTNFNDGGRLASVQGNIIRNLFRREQEPVDKRGVGIAVEADTTVVGNVIEAAPTAAIAIGWHEWMRNVAATGNIIRDAGIGVAVSGHHRAGSAVIASNVIAGARNGAVRTMRGDTPYGADLTANPNHTHAGLAVHGNRVS